MTRQWQEFAGRIESGDSDRINDAIDEMADESTEIRIESFEDCFEGLTDLYAEADDGYVRQACVRFAEKLAPGLPAVVNLHTGHLETATESELRDQTNAVCGFYLEALTDDDGRVRQSAQRGLKAVFRTYDELDDRETAEAVLAEIDEMAASNSGKRREHLFDAREDARYMLESGIGRIVREFAEKREDS